MSAPTSHDPLVVNTRDGVCWERRAVTDCGLGLYAVEGSCKCPPFKMATLAELAARGIVGSADVLPVPVGPEPLSAERLAGIEALAGEATAGPWCTDAWEIYQGAEYVPGISFWIGETCRGTSELGQDRADAAFVAAARSDVPALVAEVRRQAARIAELEAERHSTNEALDDAVQALRTDRPAEAFVPQTERSHWVAIADALNAAHAAGMPVGIDMDGTLTDHNAWSVVWDRAADQWAVAGYEDGFPALDAAARKTFAERADRETDSGRRAAYRMLAEPEPEFHAYLHHDNRVGHDLPETGGARDLGACKACGSMPEQWCPDCGCCQKGCYDGHVDNPCTHPNTSWATS